MREGRFREDLYYRLNVIPVTLPPLRERKEDIPLLVDHFLEHLGGELGRRVDGVSAAAMAQLTAHDWPGNVRELRNVLERAVVVASGTDPPGRGPRPAGGRGSRPERGAGASLDEVERRHIASVLEASHGNVSHAARILEIDRVTLYNKIEKYGLRRERAATGRAGGVEQVDTSVEFFNGPSALLRPSRLLPPDRNPLTPDRFHRAGTPPRAWPGPCPVELSK